MFIFKNNIFERSFNNRDKMNEDNEIRKTKQSRSLQWDEETIAEHDKLRGTRQKIDEPPTPYAYESYDTEGSTHPYLDSPLYHSDSSTENMRISSNNTPPLGSSPAGLQPRDSLMNNWENLQVIQILSFLLIVILTTIIKGQIALSAIFTGKSRKY